MPKYIKEDDHRWEKYVAHEKEHGWSPDELWSLDHTIADFIYPRLVGFRERTCTYPGTLSGMDEWKEILDKMIKSFKYIKDEQEYYTKVPSEELHEGLDLFRKYFFNLWD
tara:strand:+ start:1642 stop:1971 length:330 start_codon:yes stop_codon:yes gene_type:complete